ncbi:DODA-type extradiol aromatic ring-opening family dioxygenase [Desulfogranum japonicum]|uniref:DODA-type extradiol aromatic ring-opening family dioxygenase n=1 Tax=Desulfogranum japonicum TaxID=231447 RepID=UPI0003FF6A3D|nr:class III extradiol ring-cleavage dioxygenase [Desulfogranum japonicum]
MNTETTSTYKGTVIYFSHGGGPMPILGEPSHQAMIAFMEQLPQHIPKPEAILVISAHWEEETATILSGSHPPLLYDYYGFPEEAYSLTYPAPGNPGLAKKISELLEEQGLTARPDTERGFDHGLFIPLKMMYPRADIPSLQLSLVKGLDPAIHLKLGKALHPLLQQNILVIGSGFSFHNMREFLWDGSNPADEANDQFQDWLVETCTAALSPAQREEQLLHWSQAPSARYCHPREEHLLPLHVCVGMAGYNCQGTKIFDDYILGKRAVAFQWLSSVEK